MIMKSIKELKLVDVKIVIFGAGDFGSCAYLYCSRAFPQTYISFCDNNKDRQSERIQGCEIISPKKAVCLYPKAAYVLASADYAEEMYIQLSQMGILDEQIFLFAKEECYHLLTLDEMWEINKKGYEQLTHRTLDKRKLNTYTEKMQYSKIYDADGLRTRLTDKYRVKEWVKEKIGEEYVVPLLGVYKNADEIDFDKLPEKFVLKANHGCGMNYIVKDKEKEDITLLREELQKCLEYHYMDLSFELQYREIQPCIIAEKYIEEFHKESYDYKFFCFDGKVQMIMIVKNIEQEDAARCFYDADFHFVPCELDDGVRMPEVPFKKPASLEKMVEIAEQLSDGMDQVRVDLYAPGENIYFGEMTFTSWGGNVNITPAEIDYQLGSYWRLGDIR